DSKEAHDGKEHCRYRVRRADDRSLLVGRFSNDRPLFTFYAIHNGSFFAWLEIFADGFGVRSSRAHTVTGIYGRWLGMPLRHNARPENIFPIMYLPPSVDLFEVHACVSALRSFVCSVCSRLRLFDAMC